MEIKRMYAPKHINGHYITVRGDRTNSIKSAVRFTDNEDLMRFIYGIYGPDDPENYNSVPIKITYEEDDEHADSEGRTKKSEIEIGD